MKKRNGFTLVEILVVISIIAILAAILLPSIAAVRRHVKKALSESLIANIGMGLESYSSDFSGLYPPDTIDNPSLKSCGEDLETGPKVLCFFLESQFMSDDGRRSGAYFKYKDSNKYGVPVPFLDYTDSDNIIYKLSVDYIVDSFGNPVLYDERKSEAYDSGASSYASTGLNPNTFVIISGGAEDKSPSADATTVDSKIDATIPWTSDQINIFDTVDRTDGTAGYLNAKPPKNNFNDDIYNK